MTTHDISLTLNGEPRVVKDVPSDRLLIDLLRDDIGATGTKLGCGAGVCGLCAVLVNGELLSGCLLPAVYVDGAAVTTVEGLAAADGTLSPLQEAFITKGGFQCGICTSGQLITATALLRERPRPTEPEITEWMQGSLCRCTGYRGIIDAIKSAAGVA